MVDGNGADQTQINLTVSMYVHVPSLPNEKAAVSLKHALALKHSGTKKNNALDEWTDVHLIKGTYSDGSLAASGPGSSEEEAS